MFMFSNGGKQMNPIHGADIAKVCLDAVNSNGREIAEGGLMAIGLFNRHFAVMMSFAVEAVGFDHVAPAYGPRHLRLFCGTCQY